MTHIIRGYNYGAAGAGNYATFEADGTLRLAGNATVFDDLRVEGATARAGVVAHSPARDALVVATRGHAAALLLIGLQGR